MGGIFTHPPFKHRLIESQSAVGVGGCDPHDEAQVQRKEVGSFKPGELRDAGVLSVEAEAFCVDILMSAEAKLSCYSVTRHWRV